MAVPAAYARLFAHRIHHYRRRRSRPDIRNCPEPRRTPGDPSRGRPHIQGGALPHTCLRSHRDDHPHSRQPRPAAVVYRPMRPRSCIGGAWRNACAIVRSRTPAPSSRTVSMRMSPEPAPVVIQPFRFADKTGSVVGLHEWEEEVLEETGGDVLLCYVRQRSPFPASSLTPT